MVAVSKVEVILYYLSSFTLWLNTSFLMDSWKTFRNRGKRKWFNEVKTIY